MKKSAFKRLMDMIRHKNISFSRLRDNPAGSKMAARCEKTSRRGADGTMRS